MAFMNGEFANNDQITTKAKKKSPGIVEIPRLFVGGRYRTRTCDPLHVKQVLIPAELTVRHSKNYYSAGVCTCQAFFSCCAKKYLETELRRVRMKYALVAGAADWAKDQ